MKKKNSIIITNNKMAQSILATKKSNINLKATID